MLSLQNKAFHLEASSTSISIILLQPRSFCSYLCLLKLNLNSRSAALLCRSSVLSVFAAGQRFSEASPLPLLAEPATTKGSFTAVSAQTICPVICALTEVTMGGPPSHERIHSGLNNEGFCSPIQSEPQKREQQDLSLCLLPHCSGKVNLLRYHFPHGE